ncbi:putative cAMP-regulated D2 protein-like [Apostichopus japonicus]|uniref:Carboxylic ester hydrolase n=1 Tax=Stichopus japonicus TaxID=307972 RepID=A0A2G8JH93_STIJA|nr:putative cAMP-regulated D2 protein-like [Apostichopus japonicus]
MIMAKQNNSCVFVLVFVLCFVNNSVYGLFDPDDLIVETPLGKLQGVDLGESYAFGGVPFGKPPVGPLRFNAPEPPEPWSGIHPANYFGIGCSQTCYEPSSACPTTIQEDCLYLNIWVPKDIFEDPTPRGVFVFIHGGNFHDGAGGVPLYDSRFLVNNTGIISVTINYRMSAFGFLYLGDIFDPYTNTTSKHANYGMQDQQLAFKYVQDNIHLFGGDPTMVTVAGQSAGAQSIGLHLLSNESEPLFQQTYMISNPYGLPYKNPKDATKLAEYFAEAIGCPPLDITCFREKEEAEVLAASKSAQSNIINPLELFQYFEQWNPTVGEGEYPEEPVMAYEEGNFQRKPTMAGSVTEEGRAYVYGVFGNEVPWWMYRILLRLLVPKYGQEVIDQYTPVTLSSDQREVLNRLVTDYLFLCATSHVSQMMGNYGVDVYNYANDASISFSQFWEHVDICKGYPCHGGDLAYIFRTAPLVNATYTPGEQAMMDDMTSYIGNFVRTGNPNTPVNNNMREKQNKKLAFWPRVDEKSGNSTYTMYFSACKNSVIGNYRKEFCDTLDAFGYYQVLFINSYPSTNTCTCN